MKSLLTIRAALVLLLMPVLFLSQGCSCAITSLVYRPEKRKPPLASVQRAADRADFKMDLQEGGRVRYLKGAAAVYFIPEDGELELINSHCPLLPFGSHPGHAYDRRRKDLNGFVAELRKEGYAYNPEGPGKRGGE